MSETFNYDNMLNKFFRIRDHFSKNMKAVAIEEDNSEDAEDADNAEDSFFDYRYNYKINDLLINCDNNEAIRKYSFTKSGFTIEIVEDDIGDIS